MNKKQLFCLSPANFIAIKKSQFFLAMNKS